MSEDEAMETKELRLGESVIECCRRGEPGEGVALIHVHQNEWSALEAGKRFQQRQGGQILCFAGSNTRCLEFIADGRKWRVDPNRLFSNQGIQDSLRKLSAQAPDDVCACVAEFAAHLLDWWDLASVDGVVALHNTDGDYSVLSYGDQGEEAHNAHDVFIHANKPIHDFFFVTEAYVFERLRECGHQVVLQKEKGWDDDGSLSTYCADRKIPYVNVEARYGATEDQEMMLKDLWSLWRKPPV
jgi:hypothetical protein